MVEHWKKNRVNDFPPLKILFARAFSVCPPKIDWACSLLPHQLGEQAAVRGQHQESAHVGTHVPRAHDRAARRNGLGDPNPDAACAVSNGC